MAKSNKNPANRGFQGLSGLVTDIEGRKDEGYEVQSSGSQGQESRSGFKILFGLLAICFVVAFFSNQYITGKQNRSGTPMNFSPPVTTQTQEKTPVARKGNFASSTTSQSRQDYSEPESRGVKYKVPPPGRNHVLYSDQIAWCLKEAIIINQLRSRISNYVEREVNLFNQRVDYYNDRCGSYKYKRSARSSAERLVEEDRGNILNEAMGILNSIRNPNTTKTPRVGASNKVNSSSQNTQKSSAQDQVAQDFFNKLSRRLPGWEEQNKDPEFIKWLRNKNRKTGKTVQEHLDEAARNADVETVANIFEEFRKIKNRRNKSQSVGNSNTKRRD